MVGCGPGEEPETTCHNAVAEAHHFSNNANASSISAHFGIDLKTCSETFWWRNGSRRARRGAGDRFSQHNANKPITSQKTGPSHPFQLILCMRLMRSELFWRRNGRLRARSYISAQAGPARSRRPLFTTRSEQTRPFSNNRTVSSISPFGMVVGCFRNLSDDGRVGCGPGEEPETTCLNTRCGSPSIRKNIECIIHFLSFWNRF